MSYHAAGMILYNVIYSTLHPSGRRAAALAVTARGPRTTVRGRRILILVTFRSKTFDICHVSLETHVMSVSHSLPRRANRAQGGERRAREAGGGGGGRAGYERGVSFPTTIVCPYRDPYTRQTETGSRENDIMVRSQRTRMRDGGWRRR